MQEESKGNGALALTREGDRIRVVVEREDADYAWGGVQLGMKFDRRLGVERGKREEERKHISIKISLEVSVEPTRSLKAAYQITLRFWQYSSTSVSCLIIF